jgi:hypothetical protein
MCVVDRCRWDYMGESGRYYEDMDRTVAFQRGLTTWANWVDLNLDQAKTRVFFQSMSPTHYRYYSQGVFRYLKRAKNFCIVTVTSNLWTYAWSIKCR